jgi:hypothetical protein
MKRFAFSTLALLTLSSLASANGQCAGRRGLAQQQSQFFRAPSYNYSQGCYGCYGGQPQQAPAPAPVCDTCPQQSQQQYQYPAYAPQQFDVQPTCPPQQQFYQPQQQLSYAPQQFDVQPVPACPPRTYIPRQRSFPAGYAGAGFVPGYAEVLSAPVVPVPVYVRQRFPRFLGPPVVRVPHFPFPGRLPFPGGFPFPGRHFPVAGAGFFPGVPLATGGGANFFFRNRNTSIGFSRF